MSPITVSFVILSKESVAILKWDRFPGAFCDFLVSWKTYCLCVSLGRQCVLPCFCYVGEGHSVSADAGEPLEGAEQCPHSFS